MRSAPISVIALLFVSAAAVEAQQPATEVARTRVVVTSTMPAIKPTPTLPPRLDPTQVPQPASTPIVVGSIKERGVDVIKSSSTPHSPRNERPLSFSSIKSKIAEAKRILQTRPLPTASVDSTVPMDFVRVAFNDSKTDEIDFVVMSKDAFLSKGTPRQVVSQNGRTITAETIRGNGVNTPITLIDGDGTRHVPLLVQYPVIRNGKYIETAYYMSTHPGLVTPEVVNAGRLYVKNVIELARERLRGKGIVIQPKIADIAERLAAVEHVDHLRFRTEPHENIYNDIYTLYALNEGQTYRYSVSSAGAGGMVQMIPSTYRMVRSWHPNVPLDPDFVGGMRNHVNATEAMLLYMKRTWDDLNASPTVANALETGIATPEQLMAAGYNSNPARLAGYINRGGANWTNLIPRETQIYLQIYDSIERNVPMKPRAR